MRIRRHKYNALRTVVDGHSFASKREAARYMELKLLEKAGEIWELELQPSFDLMAPSTSGYLRRAAEAIANGGLFKVGRYVGDFKYRDKATVPYVVEDVKGMDTRLSRWKRKHCEIQYGIQIRVVA